MRSNGNYARDAARRHERSMQRLEEMADEKRQKQVDEFYGRGRHLPHEGQPFDCPFPHRAGVNFVCGNRYDETDGGLVQVRPTADEVAAHLRAGGGDG